MILHAHGAMRPSLLVPIVRNGAPILGSLGSRAFNLSSPNARQRRGYQIPLPRQHGWNRAVASAEKLVGFPTSVLQLQALMLDDATSMAVHLRKLAYSDHPILKTIKRLVHHEGKTNVQVRGLIILLLAKATATEHVRKMFDYDPQSGVTERHRKLGEVVEMIQSTKAIHKSVLNLPMELTKEDERSTTHLKEDLADLEYGNKLAILAGDYLLATACTKLASLRNTHVTESVAVSIAEFAQSEFIGKRDVQGRFVPNGLDQLSMSAWLQRNQLAHGSLMGNGCRSVGLFSELSNETLTLLDRLGSNIALALQVFTEVEPYTGCSVLPLVATGHAIDLSAAPVLFHLESDTDLFHRIQSCEDNIENLDHDKIFDAVKNGPGVAKAQELKKNISDECSRDIEKLPDTDATSELRNLLARLSE